MQPAWKFVPAVISSSSRPSTLKQPIEVRLIISAAFEYKDLSELKDEFAVSAFFKKDGTQMIQLGCFLRTRQEWDANFWNNDKEFPNDGSERSEARLRAYKTACFFLDQLQSKPKGE